MLETQPERVGRYRLLRRIGRGGMGDVYLAQFQSRAGIRRLAAVKVLREAADDQNKKALLGEARVAALVAHPNVVQVFDADFEHGVPWLAMEFVPGLSLHELLALGPVPPWVSARIMADLCEGVHAVHRATDERGKPLHIVHRDISPHNVLVSWDGIVKLADFGVARSSLQSNMTRDGVLKGKLGYMSPEQAGGAPVDQRSDIFALGIVLWEALARARLFSGGNNSETLAAVLRCEIVPLRVIAPHVPEPLVQITERALAARPADRFSTALELARSLSQAIVAAGAHVAEAEVGHFIASVTPERVREHERWLTDGSNLSRTPPEPSSSRGAKTLPTATITTEDPSVAATRHALVTGETPVSRRPRSSVASWGWFMGGAATLGATLVVGYFRGWFPDLAPDRATPAPSIDMPRMATEPVSPRSVVGHASGPAPTFAPENRAPVASSLQTVSTPPPLRSASNVASAPSRAEPVGTGTLNVSARPTWATVRIDGKVAGSTPTVIRNLRVGPHTLEALPRGKEPGSRKTVTVRRDNVTNVEFVFD